MEIVKCLEFEKKIDFILIECFFFFGVVFELMFGGDLGGFEIFCFFLMFIRKINLKMITKLSVNLIKKYVLLYDLVF